MSWYKRAQSEREREYPLEEGEESLFQTEEDRDVFSKDSPVSEILNDHPNIRYQPIRGGSEILYHGGRKKFDIEVDEIPSNGLFLSNKREVAIVNAMSASKYWQLKASGADVSTIAEDKIAEFYVDLKRPFIVDAKEENWLNVPIPEEMRKDVFETMRSVDTDNVGEWAKENNYDGAIIKNVVEGKGSLTVGDTYIVFNKNSLIPVLKTPKKASFDKNWYKIAQVAGEIGTDIFRKWFGNSVVIDSNREPLIVYKGMPTTSWRTNEPIEEIDRSQGDTHSSFGTNDYAGFFTSNSEVAGQFATLLTEQGLGSGIYPVYLKIERPFIIDAKGGFAGDIQFGRAGDSFREALANEAYDGVIIKNTKDEGDVYVPKKPHQVKSIYNPGTFDPGSSKLNY